MRQVALLQADRRERQVQEEREPDRVPELERQARSQATLLQADHPERRAPEERQPPKVLPLREAQKPVRPGKHVTRSPNPCDSVA